MRASEGRFNQIETCSGPTASETCVRNRERHSIVMQPPPGRLRRPPSPFGGGMEQVDRKQFTSRSGTPRRSLCRCTHAALIPPPKGEGGRRSGAQRSEGGRVGVHI